MFKITTLIGIECFNVLFNLFNAVTYCESGNKVLKVPVVYTLNSVLSSAFVSVALILVSSK
jgi:succinyl-CoA synthetase alpha subunit